MTWRALTAGFVSGMGLGIWGRRAWRKGLTGGPRRSLGNALEGGVSSVPLAIFQSTGVSFLEGNDLRWVNNGTVFDEVERAFGQAEHSIHVDMYIWKPGGKASRLAEVAAQRAREGVKVRILVDPLGSEGFQEELCVMLQDAGCEVHFFRPPRHRPLKIWGRNHRKLIVVDGKVGFTGGFGIAPEWEGDGLSPKCWRDSNVRVEGPVVRQMQQAFAAHWLETGGPLLPEEEFERCQEAGDARACFITSMDVKGLSNARWTTHIAIASAQKRLWIANAYFVPPADLMGAMAARRKDGVDVRILLPGPYTDHLYVKAMQRATYPPLLRAGLRMFEYQPSMIHAKTMVVDGRLAVVGSTNLDPLSQDVLEEGALMADNAKFAGELEKSYLQDLQRSHEIQLPEPLKEMPLPFAATAEEDSLGV
jgi:cardiolipin synthase